MSPRIDVSEQRREQILTAAETVVADNGLDSLRMDEVADRTGLSKGTLYLYFKNKHDLSLALLKRVLEQELDAVEGITATAADAENALRAFVERVVADVERVIRVIPISYGFLSIAFRNRHVQQALKQYVRRYIDSLVPILRSGMESGEFQPVDPQEAAIAVASVVEGTMALWMYDRTMIEPARHIRSGVENLLHGLRRRHG